jgi:hypothetical protein
MSYVREDGELSRLRILLLESAFEAGLAPRDLIHLWVAAPNLRRAMAVEPTHRLGLLFGIWRSRKSKSWESVARAETVFTLARNSPPTAAHLLAQYPDLLLVHRPDRDSELLVGPVLVCARGIAIDGVFTADPGAEVRLTSEGRVLVFGRHRLDVSRRLSADLPVLIKKWLRYRAEVLVPFIEESLASGSEEVVQRVLGPFCRRCLACGTISAVSAGAIGQVILT